MMASITQEETFLETYFTCISQFSYDKAKDLCDRERESHKTAPPTATWSSMVSVLGHLVTAEKTYSSLLFLGQKWFGRKDNLRTSYSQMLTELKKIEETTTGRLPMASSRSEQLDEVFEGLMGHLSGQIIQFLTARAKAMDFYEQMAVMGTNRNMNYNDLLQVIVDITHSNNKNFHHPILSPLKHSFSLECEVIQHLLHAQLHMQYYQFLETILHLNDAHGKLAVWQALLPAKEAKKLTFGSSKGQPTPALYQWLVKYKSTLVAKFSLYFYDVLSKQTAAPEMKTMLTKTGIDFYSKIVTFQKKSDAAHVALVFDSTGLEGIQRGAGYHHPFKFTEPPKGLDSFPAIFNYPNERAEKHWPEVISIITDKTAELSTIDRHIYFFDEKLQVTYFLSRIEPRITLAVIFENKKAEKDSYVNNFLVDITTQLRCTKMFASLRPGTKS